MSSQGVPPDQPPPPGGQPPVPGGGQGPAGNPPQGAPRGDPQSGGASQGFPPSDPTQGYPQQGSGEPPRKSRAWLWVVLVVLVAAGVAAGIIASENKSSPATVINQQTTSTVNSLGVTVQAPPAQKDRDHADADGDRAPEDRDDSAADGYHAALARDNPQNDHDRRHAVTARTRAARRRGIQPRRRSRERRQTVSDDPLDSLRLVDDAASLEATFLPSAGMLCCSLRHRGEELLAQNDGVDAYAQRGKTMGVPLLYPWANRLAGFGYHAAGRTVEVPRDATLVAVDGNGLPIHGVIGGQLAFELADAPAGPARSATATLRWDETRARLFEVFPFAHTVRYTAALADGALQITVEIEASGADPVPVAFGFHPYLAPAEGERERWQVQLPAMRALRLDARQIPAGPGAARPARRLRLDDEQFDDGFDELRPGARFSVVGGGRRIAIELVEGYPCAQVYAPPASTFICFEPMTAPANALCSGEGLRVLDAGERACAVFSIAVADAEDRPNGG